MDNIKDIFHYFRFKNNLDFYIELMRRGIPLPKEWIKDAERLAKIEGKMLEI